MRSNAAILSRIHSRRGRYKVAERAALAFFLPYNLAKPYIDVPEEAFERRHVPETYAMYALRKMACHSKQGVTYAIARRQAKAYLWLAGLV